MERVKRISIGVDAAPRGSTELAEVRSEAAGFVVYAPGRSRSYAAAWRGLILLVAMGETIHTDRGLFMVLDGTEGSGKSTQARRLGERLVAEGLPAITTRDPGTTDVGERVRAILLDPAMDDMAMRCEMLLYMAARAQMMQQIILPALSEGKIVICDRFVSSTLAYQLGGEGLTAGEIRQVGEVAIRARWPDLTLLLDMPAEQSLARVKGPKDRIEQRSLAYHQKVRGNYLAQAREQPGKFRIIPADCPIDAVAADVWATASEAVAKWREKM